MAGFAGRLLRNSLSGWGPIGVRSGHKTYKDDLTPANSWQGYNPMENQLIALICGSYSQGVNRLIRGAL